eukprot:CAMPEP_0181298692 /NCGR_PEP_ID=MMETSP1101-20121128/5922_1 /TAXON_ID=46948 /ORGANISM="Rhodomonas abbreviata, Strain Caron Lab Isolate" /LENGTH=344 /DNA_ID=CAMNT_0023403739 /DNA_START=1 /DNA_END=1035 /DNA_ORIENTATION=+
MPDAAPSEDGKLPSQNESQLESTQNCSTTTTNVVPEDVTKNEDSPVNIASQDEGKRMVEECMALFADDKVFQASRLERRIAAEFPDLHEENLEKLKKVSTCAEEADRMCADLDGDEGWKCVREAAKEGDVKVWYRPEKDCAIHALRVDAIADASLEYMLVLINEVTLFKEWLPFIGGSELLARPSRCERVAWWKMWSPAAALVQHRDCCLHGTAIDGLDEDGCVLVLIRGHEEGVHGVEHPELKPRTTRMEIKYAAVKLIPLPDGRTRVRAVGSVDPKLQVLPAWLINWIATKVCAVGMHMWESNAKRVEEGKKDCAHRQRMREDAEFYTWMTNRVQSAVPRQQ